MSLRFLAHPCAFRIVKRRSVFGRLPPVLRVHGKSLSLDAGAIPKITETRIKECLSINGVRYVDGFACIALNCPCCGGKAETLFVNKVSGFCVCVDCKRSGEWDAVESWISDRRKTTLRLSPHRVLTEGSEEWNEIAKNLCDLPSVPKHDLIGLVRKLDLKASAVKVLTELGACMDLEREEVVVPLQYRGLKVGFKRLLAGGREETSTGALGLISRGLTSKGAPLIVQSLTQLLGLPPTYPAYLLPHGGRWLPQEVLPLLEQHRKLVLVLPDNTPAWHSMSSFAKKLDESRCFIVRGSDVIGKKAEEVKKVVDNAQRASHPSITRFDAIRAEVLAELQNTSIVCGVQWKRFPALNKLLKGHRRGELTVVTGPTGSGKTTLMSEYSLDLAQQGVTTLWGSFEVRNCRLAKTMLQQYVGLPLEDHLDKFEGWADDFQELPLFFMTFHGQQSLQHVLEAVEHATYIHDVAHVIIDNVQFMLGLTASESGFLDRFYRQDALIGEFRRLASERNVHVTLVIHPRKEKQGEALSASSIFGGAKATQEADNVLIIQSTTLQSLKTKKFLQVAKNRFSGDLGVMSLNFEKSSLSFAPKNSEPSTNRSRP